MSSEFHTFLPSFGPLLLLGLGLLFYGVRQRARARASAAWPRAQGQVLSSEVQRRVSHSRNGGTRISYEPQIEYEYLVDGARYRSKRVSFGSRSRSTAQAAGEDLTQTVKAGLVDVYYNPVKPGEAVLLCTEAPGTLGFIIGGIALSAASAGLWLYFFVLPK